MYQKAQMTIAGKARFSTSAILLVCGLFSVEAGEKIRFSNPTNRIDVPFELNRTRQNKAFENSLNPSSLPSGDPGAIPFVVPPAAPVSRAPNAKDEKKKLEKDWIFMTADSASKNEDSEANNEDETSPEKVLGIKDYLLPSASKQDGMRNFVQGDTKKNENEKSFSTSRDPEKEKGSDRDNDRESRRQDGRIEYSSDSNYSLGSVLLEKYGDRPGNFETKTSYNSLFPANEKDDKKLAVEKEQKQQMSDFKGLIRPREEGGSKILFDSLNPDAAPKGFAADRFTSGSFKGLAAPGSSFNNPFAPRPAVAASPTPAASAFEAPSFAPAGPSRTESFAPRSSGSARVEAKPAVLPFPKRPGAL